MNEVWTIPSLKEHLECKVAGLKDLVFGILVERDKAVSKELADAKDRANASNEIRGAMVDQQKTFATIQQFEALKESLAEVKAELAAIKNKTAGAGQLWGMLLAVVVAVAAINGIIFAVQGASG